MRKSFFSVLLISVLLLSGCANINSDENAPTAYNSPNSSAAVSESNDTTVTSDSSATPSTNQTVSDIDTSQVQGKITNLHYIDDNKILIVADNLYLYDLYSGSILKQTERASFSEENYQAIENGFAVIGIGGDNNGDGGMIVVSGDSVVSCIIYDIELNKVLEIRGSQLVGEDELFFSPLLLTVSWDGTKIAYATDMALYLYDIATGNKSTLINLADDDAAGRSGLSIFEELAFINGGSTIAFVSKSFDVPAVVGASSFDTYGTINADGTGLSVKRSTDYSVKNMIAYDSMIFWAEDFTVSSGRLMLMDNRSGESRILNLASTLESGCVFGSESGQYFATATINEDSVIVRVYDAETATLLLEEAIIEESEYMSRQPVIRVFDNSKTCLVLLGNRQSDIATKILTFNF